MFTSIEQGLDVYREAVKSYLLKYGEIDKRAKEWLGDKYGGVLSWPKDDYEWKKNTEQQIFGMEIALNLTKEETAVILAEVRAPIAQ